MTTQDFIAKTYGTTSDRERRCSSVFADYRGNVYSYGYHYPLVFNVDGLDFVNCTGYSSTTAKHIAWAKRAVPNAIEVWLPPRTFFDGAVDYNLDDMISALHSEERDIVRRMRATKRKNTAKYQALCAEHIDNITRTKLVERVWVA